MEGNQMKMREALENSNGLLEELTAIGDWGESAREQIAENNAALSAPARNCDRFADAPSAYADFIVPWKLEGHFDDVPTLQDFSNWLFAPAQEGGEK